MSETGETTDDGDVTLERIECQAACSNAPVMTANWEFLDDMTVEKAKQVVDDIRAGRQIRAAPVARQFESFATPNARSPAFDDGLSRRR